MTHPGGEIETGFARTGPAGLRLHYRRAGGDGPTVVLLHGWPQTGRAWRHVMPTLADAGCTAVAPDLRGSGDSDRPSGGYDPATRAEDVRSLLRALGLEDGPVFVVGHSDGGAAVAQAYAQAYPDETAALALVGAVPGTAASAWHFGFHGTPDLPELLIGPQTHAYVGHFLRAWAHDPDTFSDADVAAYAAPLTEPGALRASLAPFRVASRVLMGGGSPVPVLVLLGESDPRFGSLGAPGCPPGTRLQTIPRGGHWLPEERPDPVAAALLTFFAEVREGRAG